MKILYFAPIILVAFLLLGGCGAKENPSGTPANTAQQTAALKAIPPQAQAGVNQQSKNQMDAMRAKDAAKKP